MRRLRMLTSFSNSAAHAEEVPELKKPKIDTSIQQLEQLIVTQNKEFFAHRDFVQSKQLKRSNWIQILEVNNQKIPKTDDEVCNPMVVAVPNIYIHFRRNWILWPIF